MASSSSNEDRVTLTPPPRGCELLSTNIFDDIDCANAEEGEDELLKRREPTMQRRGKKLVAPLSQEAGQRYTVVFDLDETVVYARDGPLYARAYLRDLLAAVKGSFEVIVWTAGDREYAKNVLTEINADHVIDHLIYRHDKWFKEDDYTKDLRQLGRDTDHVIIIENTPDCVRRNPGHAIVVQDFEVPPCDDAAEEAGGEAPRPKRAATDRTLLLLREVLEGLAQSGEPVPVYLSHCELLSRQTVVSCDGGEIPIYYLGPRRRRRDTAAARKVVKANRDRAPAGAEEERAVAPVTPHAADEDDPATAATKGTPRKTSRAEAVEPTPRKSSRKEERDDKES